MCWRRVEVFIHFQIHVLQFSSNVSVSCFDLYSLLRIVSFCSDLRVRWLGDEVKKFILPYISEMTLGVTIT